MKLRKLSAGLLCLLLTLPLAVGLNGCTPGNTSGTPTSGSPDTTAAPGSVTASVTDTPTDTAPQTDKNGYLLDSLPEELDWVGSKTVKILCWNAENPEFDMKEDYDTNIINNSIYRRNLEVSRRLGVALEFTQQSGDSATCAAFRDFVSNVYSGGDYYDFIGAYTRSAALCASSGLLLDLGNIENSYLDFSAPWWNENLIDNISMNGTFFSCTGDISTNFIQMIYCVYFNENIIRDRELESPYELVASNEWTIENMLNLSEGYYADTDNIGVKDSGDDLTMVCYYWDAPALTGGCGIKYVSKDDTGNFIIDSSLSGTKMINLVDELIDWVKTGGIIDPAEGCQKIFTQGKTMFWITESGSALKMSNVSFTYGCVPCPKYDSEQSTYYSMVRQPISLYSLMRNLPEERISQMTAVLECFGSEGYRKTTPAIYETSMKGQKAQSEDMMDMLDLITKTAAFDCGRVYAREFKGVVDEPGIYIRDGKQWSQYLSSNLTALEKSASDFSMLFLQFALH